MKTSVIMSHIFNSYYTHRALESIGSHRPIYLVDNSFCGEMKTYAMRNPHVHYLRPKVRPLFDHKDAPLEATDTAFHWRPLTCAASWNLAMEAAETDWVINVNPDTMMLPQSLELMEVAIKTRADDVVLLRTPVNFNFWSADRSWLLGIGGYDTRYKPCGGEDEDLLVRIGTNGGAKWQKCGVPAYHQDGGHKDRVDGYCNIGRFEDKWGFRPNTPEFREVITKAHAGGA